MEDAYRVAYRSVRGPLRTTWPPAWLKQPEPAPDSTLPVGAEPEPPAVAALPVEQPTDGDEWPEIDEKSREYLLGPRAWPEPCPWCHGRLRHNPLCIILNDWVPILPFGRHKGKPVSEVPRSYLDWLLQKSTALREGLRDDITAWMQDSGLFGPRK
jgi:uncharacterized protein (DUF3820 family)